MTALTSRTTITTTKSTSVTTSSTGKPTTASTATTSSSTSSIIATVPPCILGTQAYQAYMSVNLILSISDGENGTFFNRTTTIQDLKQGLNAALRSYFPQSFLKLNILMMSNEPVILWKPSINRRKRDVDQTAIIIIVGSSYFIQDQTASEISQSLQNYMLNIDLSTTNGGASTKPSSFSSHYSFFEDTFSTELTTDEINDLNQFC
ncbi:unnamed protein product [Adineta steineri]|uniref:Uncharacterized protein n=2 Tax=Adineta steineri TaxID=433720 RepID=A0A818WVY4_9BILA|nr:unnamed protein product [Adineta steineri]